MSKMKYTQKMFPMALLISLLVSYACNAQIELEQQSGLHDNAQLESMQLQKQASLKIKEFAGTLKQTLMSAINSGELSDGIAVCHLQAPEIASALSVDGWIIKRTSLKTRNSHNQPDEWEQSILNQFQAQYESGQAIDDLVISSVENKQFRLMKAIPTGSVCLGCHGSNIDPTTRKKLNALYPNDKAIGFNIGALRGAFSVQKSIVE